MAHHDRILEETANMRNSLESFIYELRNSVSDKLSPYLTPEDKSKLESACEAAEDWLYSDEGFDSQKSVYAIKLKDLTGLATDAEFRLAESTERPAATAELVALCEEYKRIANDSSKSGHWSDEEKATVRDAAAAAEAWVYEQVALQATVSAAAVPVLTSADIRAKIGALRDGARAILTKPVPAPVVEEKMEEENKTEEADAAAAPAASAEMDLD